MLNIFDNKENVSMFESFSDIALCTLSISLLMVALLAVNITKRQNIKVTENHYATPAGDSTRYVACSQPDFSKTSSAQFAAERVLYGAGDYVAVHLLDDQLADGSVERSPGESRLNKNFSVPLYLFMMIVPGVEPVDGTSAQDAGLLAVSDVGDRNMLFGDLSAVVDASLSSGLLNMLWPKGRPLLAGASSTEENPMANVRIYAESRSVQTEHGEEHYVVIGHCSYRLPDALKDGSLAWLQEFMSDSVEMVYLGETWSRPEDKTSRRIQFFEENGYGACAAAYREFAFPDYASGANRSLVSQLTAQGMSEQGAAESAYWAGYQREASKALVGGSLVDVFPPLLRYRDAWAAYVAQCEAENAPPPQWFYSEFLEPLNFDRIAIAFDKIESAKEQ